MKTVHRLTMPMGYAPAPSVRATERHEVTVTKEKRVRKQDYRVFVDANGQRVDRHGCAKKGEGWNRVFPSKYWDM